MLAISGTHVENFCRDRFVRRLRKSRKCTGSPTMVYCSCASRDAKKFEWRHTNRLLKNPRDCFISRENIGRALDLAHFTKKIFIMIYTIFNVSTGMWLSYLKLLVYSSAQSTSDSLNSYPYQTSVSNTIYPENFFTCGFPQSLVT